jgi:hypothetical protein
VVEDEIMRLLGEKETKKFYNRNKVNFLVPKALLKNLVKKPNYY